MKKLILKAMAKAAKSAVNEASGSKSLWTAYEPEMPACLKAKKLNK